MYRTYKGFQKLGEYNSILEAKNSLETRESGVYSVIGDEYSERVVIP